MTGAELDDWLMERRWSVINFAREIGVSRKSVYFWLSGKNRIPADVEERLPLLPRTPTGGTGEKRLQWPKLAVRIEGDVAWLRMVSGREVSVDAADLPLVRDFAWYSFRGRTTHYAVHACTPTEQEAGLGRQIWMHHLILPRRDGFETDHRNGNGLDNRRANLRYATRSQNQQNRAGKTGRDLPKGVTAAGKRFQAKIMADGVMHDLGIWDTVEQATDAYDRGALRHHAGFARPNNPDAKLDLLDEFEDEAASLPEPPAEDDDYEPTEVVEPFEDGWTTPRGRGRRK